MKVKHAGKFFLSITGMLLALLLMCAPALAQCAMCRAAVSGAGNAAAIARTMNLGVLVLLVPPVAIFCAIFIMAARRR